MKTRAGLQGVRALSAVGVVTLHAGVPYASHRMPGLVWPVWDQTNPVIDVVFWTIELFIMPLFLVMAGYFAAGTHRRCGPHGLLHHRSRRLLRPLLFGVIVILPIEYYIWMCGWLADGLIQPVKIRSLKFEHGIDRNLWGTAHLWFLLYVFSYVAIASGSTAFAAWLSRRWDRIGSLRAAFPVPVTAALLVTLAVASLTARPEAVWGFQHSFVPVPSKWLYCGTFFAGGWLLAVHDPQLAWLRNIGARWVGPALLCGGFAVALGRWYLEGGGDQVALVPLAALTVAAAWGMTLVILALAERRVRRLPMAIEYLATASLWIYLTHHPLVALVHIDLKFATPTLSPPIKALLAAGTATTLSLLSYEVLVRRTAFGQWLNAASRPAEVPERRSITVPSNDSEPRSAVIPLPVRDEPAPADRRRAA